MEKNYGDFMQEGKAFSITDPKIPRHWYNYLWNDTYIGFTSQVGFGESFAQDRLGRRIPVVAGRNLYIVNAKDGEYWTANGLPIHRGYTEYQCIHELGHTEIRLQYRKIKARFGMFVPREGNCEIWSVQIQNEQEITCELKIIPYIKTDLDGAYKPQGYNTGIGYYDDKTEAVVGKTYKSFGSDELKAVYGYMIGSEPVTGYDTSKNAFIGTYGEEQTPEALLEKGGCTNSPCNSEKLCLALETTISLKPGESKDLYFIVGAALSQEEIGDIRKKYLADHKVKKAQEEVIQHFQSQIDGVAIDTPDPSLNKLFNSWLKHQANMGSRWARVRHNGFRDLVSDSECIGAVNPDLGWERLKRVMSYQYPNGYAPRTFIEGKIKDNHFSDNTVWLTFAVYSILLEKGDLQMLEEMVPFNDGSVATVYEHIKRSVDFLWNFRGLHGLIKIWGGDWNDCMDQVGLQGKGVSVWLSIAWYRANKQFQEITKWRGEEKDALLAQERGIEMQSIVDQYGWDGEYYLTAYTDEGQKIGSRENQEGKIFLIPQLWAVLSGISKDGKDRKAMEAVERYLETDLGIRVSWPPYTVYDPSIGTMTQKPAGVHENGGVYLHPAAWKLAVDGILKQNDKIQEGLEKILPFHRKWTDKKAEPYILCNSYFTEETGYRYGTPGQSWRTASGPWLMKALINFVFGLQPQLEGLRLSPCLPPDWKTCHIYKRFRKAAYHITYEQMQDGACHSIQKIWVNGEEYETDLLPYEEDGLFQVKVLLERGE